jgi:hypothetical protein
MGDINSCLLFAESVTYNAHIIYKQEENYFSFVKVSHRHI